MDNWNPISLFDEPTTFLNNVDHGRTFLFPDEGAFSVTRYEVYEAYLQWLGDGKPKSLSDLFENPRGNCDIFEDSKYVVNRLFYLESVISNDSLRCFIFFEENKFIKDEQGDLILLTSSWHIQNT